MDKVKKELFFCVFFVPLYLLVYTLLLNTTHGFFYPLTQKMSFWPHLFVTGYRSPFFIKKRGCCEPVKFCLLADLFCLFDITFFLLETDTAVFIKKITVTVAQQSLLSLADQLSKNMIVLINKTYHFLRSPASA